MIWASQQNLIDNLYSLHYNICILFIGYFIEFIIFSKRMKTGKLKEKMSNPILIHWFFFPRMCGAQNATFCICQFNIAVDRIVQLLTVYCIYLLSFIVIFYFVFITFILYLHLCTGFIAYRILHRCSAILQCQ